MSTALDILAAVIVALLQETALVFFQNKASQATGGKRGSVDSNAIGTNLWSEPWRVTVHDKFAMLRLARQERLANIQKVIALLPIKRDARPDPGMAEEVIANTR